MIGIVARNQHKDMIKEFFEFFKTKWEFYTIGQRYDVVISEKGIIPGNDAKLIIVYSSEGKREEDVNQFANNGRKEEKTTYLSFKGQGFPIYSHLITFNGLGEPILGVKGTKEVAGIKIRKQDKTEIFIGYNLFEEIKYLLSVGQKKECAQIPTLEIHISILRELILDAGIGLVEIPPIPAGYEFMVCLTHDIDFLRITNHFLDRTFWGFLYRASFGSLLNFIRGNYSFRRLIKNWTAILILPLVYLGMQKDFWFGIDSYAEIESDMKGTFFLIPFKKRAGEKIQGKKGKRRAAAYDITDIGHKVKNLADKGFEIGLHGIDAWHNIEQGIMEYKRIGEYWQREEIGTRTHWLLADENSPNILDEAGFSYDSTFGYNDAVGYRGGTLQVFKPFAAKNLMELPLHIQDTALFYPSRMNLSEEKAWALCKEIIEKAKIYGGVITINWHDRSLAPERLWGDFYLRLLNEIRHNRVWFATASEAVQWFRKRRSLKFKEILINGDKIRIEIEKENNLSSNKLGPCLLFRLHMPIGRGKGYVDLPWSGEKVLECSIS